MSRANSEHNRRVTGECNSCHVMAYRLKKGLCPGCARRAGFITKKLSPYERAQQRAGA